LAAVVTTPVHGDERNAFRQIAILHRSILQVRSHTGKASSRRSRRGSAAAPTTQGFGMRHDG